MKALSVIELAKLYGMNRQSIYKRIKKGDLTKNSDGKVDFAEAIRVFGEPGQRSNPNVITLQDSTVQKSAEVDILKQQVDMLKKQLELAQEREVFQREQLQAKDEQIYSLQLLLGAPKQPQQSADSVNGNHAVDPVMEEPSSPVPTMVENRATAQVQTPEPKRRGLFGRVVRAILD